MQPDVFCIVATPTSAIISSVQKGTRTRLICGHLGEVQPLLQQALLEEFFHSAHSKHRTCSLSHVSCFEIILSLAVGTRVLFKGAF